MGKDGVGSWGEQMQTIIQRTDKQGPTVYHRELYSRDSVSYSKLYGKYSEKEYKESACNAGDFGSIPGSGRYAGEGIGYPLPYFWASLVAQLVKNPPAMRETWVPSLGWEDPPEKGKATHSSILAWRILWTV